MSTWMLDLQDGGGSKDTAWGLAWLSGLLLVPSRLPSWEASEGRKRGNCLLNHGRGRGEDRGRLRPMSLPPARSLVRSPLARDELSKP